MRRFLTKIISDPEIFQFRPVQDFFLDEAEFNLYYEIHYGQESNFKKAYKSNMRFFSSAFRSLKNATGFGGSQSPKIETKDTRFIELEQEINHLLVFLRNNLENFEVLKNGFSRLANNYQLVLKRLEYIESEQGGMKKNAFYDEDIRGFEESFIGESETSKMKEFKMQQIKIASESDTQSEGMIKFI